MRMPIHTRFNGSTTSSFARFYKANEKQFSRKTKKQDGSKKNNFDFLETREGMVVYRTQHKDGSWGIVRTATPQEVRDNSFILISAHALREELQIDIPEDKKKRKVTLSPHEPTQALKQKRPKKKPAALHFTPSSPPPPPHSTTSIMTPSTASSDTPSFALPDTLSPISNEGHSTFPPTTFGPPAPVLMKPGDFSSIDSSLTSVDSESSADHEPEVSRLYFNFISDVSSNYKISQPEAKFLINGALVASGPGIHWKDQETVLPDFEQLIINFDELAAPKAPYTVDIEELFLQRVYTARILLDEHFCYIEAEKKAKAAECKYSTLFSKLASLAQSNDPDVSPPPFSFLSALKFHEVFKKKFGSDK